MINEEDKSNVMENAPLYGEMKSIFKNPCDVVKCNKLVNGLLENRKLRLIVGTLFALLVIIILVINI